MENYAYSLLRDYFLNHWEYTHLVLCPDDLLVTNDDFDILINDVKEFDYPVISGICNLTYLDKDREKYAASKSIPGYSIKDYVFITKAEIEEWKRNKEYIQPVKFNGFALSFIRKDVISQFCFDGNQGLDRVFGINCDNRNIPMYIDIRAECFHIKYRMGFEVYEKFFVGKEPTCCIFSSKNNNNGEG